MKIIFGRYTLRLSWRNVIRSGPSYFQLSHSSVKRASIQSEARSCAGDHPSRFTQRGQNVLSLKLFSVDAPFISVNGMHRDWSNSVERIFNTKPRDRILRARSYLQLTDVSWPRPSTVSASLPWARFSTFFPSAAELLHEVFHRTECLHDVHVKAEGEWEKRSIDNTGRCETRPCLVTQSDHVGCSDEPNVNLSSLWCCPALELLFLKTRNNFG